MTRPRRHLATLLMFLTVAAAFVGLAVVLTSGPAHASVTHSIADVGGTSVTPEQAYLTALVGSAGDLTPAQGQALVEAGDQVCEAITASVPMGTVTETLGTVYHLTPAEAAHLEATAIRFRCHS